MKLQDVGLIQNELKKVLSVKRYQHILGVKNTIIKLAIRYGVCLKKAILAAILHDCAKDLPNDVLLKMASDFGILIGEIEEKQPSLLHGPVGAMLAFHNFGVHDPNILDAIHMHTLGDTNMSNLAKILFIADHIEPNRGFPGVKRLRRIVFGDLDRALLYIFDSKIKQVEDSNKILHPATVKGKEQLLAKQKKINRGRWAF